MDSRAPMKSENWEDVLRRRLPEFGHRNWIVIADSAYPAQSNPGIETIVTSIDHVEMLRKTFGAISECTHVRANIYIDAELKHICEADAPGVTEYRNELRRLVEGQLISELEHEKIIAKLDERAKLFRVLILKSTLTIPYTSVFAELDCRYWSADAEQRLRRGLANA